MHAWQPPVHDQRFLLLDADLLAQVMDEAGKFVAEVVAPLQRIGDDPGCRLQSGEVRTPPGLAHACP